MENFDTTYKDILDLAVTLYHRINKTHNDKYKKCNCFREDFGRTLLGYLEIPKENEKN